jgi:DNA-directed RNA polymerase specialized sigma24 family protein
MSHIRDRKHLRYAYLMSRGGMTRDEIAEVLGYPKTTINTWIHNALRLVGEALQKLEETGGWR